MKISGKTFHEKFERSDNVDGISFKKNVTVKIQIPERENTLAHAYNINQKICESSLNLAKKKITVKRGNSDHFSTLNLDSGKTD